MRAKPKKTLQHQLPAPAKKPSQKSDLPWVLDDPRYEMWKLCLASGTIEVSIWDGRISPILWPWFDGFRCQISGDKTIDLEFPGVDAEEAKSCAVEHVQALVHQLGAEVGLWPKKVEVMGTGASNLFSARFMVSIKKK